MVQHFHTQFMAQRLKLKALSISSNEAVAFTHSFIKLSFWRGREEAKFS